LLEPGRTAAPAEPALRAESGGDFFTAAWDAFSKWSVANTRFPLARGRDHERVIQRLLDALAECPPIWHGGAMVPQAALIPLAVEAIMADESTRFTSIHYATKCVRNQLDRWAKEGMKAAAGPGKTVETQTKAMTAARKQAEEAGEARARKLQAEIDRRKAAGLPVTGMADILRTVSV
jgi:hypothetical protein